MIIYFKKNQYFKLMIINKFKNTIHKKKLLNYKIKKVIYLIKYFLIKNLPEFLKLIIKKIHKSKKKN